MAGEKGRSRRISVWNWLGTLIVLAIPGVNIVALILFLIFAQAQAKRSFCIAYMILLILALVLAGLALLLLPDQLSALSAYLREAAVSMP